MTERGKSHAAWNESIGQLKGALIKRQDAQNTSLTLNEFLEAKFQGTSRKVPSSAAFQVGIKYGIDPALLTSVKKSAEQYIIARSGQVIYGENSFDLSGWSTDISEDGLTLAIGSILNDGANNENTGSVRVYTRENFDDAWVQKGVDIDGEAAQDYSGWSIALSDDGDRLVIGAVFNDDGVNENTGHVRVYDWNSTTSQWDQVGVDIEGGAAGDFFGYSVSLSKNKNFIAIGAPYGLNTRGYVGVYHYNAGSWNRIAYNLEGGNNGGLFGKRLSLSEDGSRLVVSAPHDFKDRGLLFLYRIDQVNNSIVLLSSKLGRDSGVKFGNSFDFKSNRLVVSETGVNQPRITTYDLSSDTFTPLPEQTITLDGPIDIHLKLSYDGNHLVYGMPGFNSEDLVLNSRPIPTGIRQTGHAEIYEREGDRWVKRGWRMSGVSSRDEFAKAVTISGNGEIVCLSVPRKDIGGTDRGCVTAYTVKPISYYVTPSITLSGLNPLPLQANTDYVEPGATTDTGASVAITGDIEDNTVEGQEYEITYTSQNGFGSVVTKTRRIVITKDPTIPTMTLNGDALAKIPIGGVFNDPSVTTSILSTVNIDTSNVNTNAPGAYEIKYTAVSSYGIPSQQEITRTLVVVYEAEYYGTPQIGTVSCMSRDGFILAVGDFIDNSVRLYEWDLIQEDWVRIGQQIEGPDDSSFGAAIDLSADGLTVVIGAPTYSDSLTGLVRVYHFDFIINQWEQKGGDIIDGASGDNLGEFVAISGDGGVVSCGTARPTGSKNPYVFTYRHTNNTDSWSKFHTYTEPVKLGSSIVSNQFTGSLNFNGSRLLLGVPVNDYTTGAVFLYDTNNDEKLASVLGTNLGDNLGQSVRLSGDGNRFAIGDVTNGCVKIYSENKITRVWNQLGSKIYDGNGGTAVALSNDGNIVTYSVMSGVNRGTIYQYKWDGTFWMPSLQEFSDSIDGNRFGRKLFVTDDGSKLFTESSSSFQLYRWNIPRASVTFNGSRIIRRQVDQVYDYDYVVTSSNVITEGIVNQAVTNDYLIKYIVTKNEQSDVAYQLVSVSGQLLQLGLNIYNYDESATPNNHGWSSSMSNDGNYLVVSSPGYDNDRGMIKIYTFNPVTIHWDIMTSLTGPNAGGNFGYSVALSGDGSRVAVGAPNHGNGLVRVYEYSDSTWTQIGSDLSGSAGGKFGWSVSLNNTGDYVTVGEPRKVFGVNTGVGEVHTFTFSGMDWSSESSKSFTNNQIEHQFGYAVDISSTNNVVVFGAPTAGPGYVKISSYISGNVPIFAQPITFGERFGWCVTVSDNGQVFAAGAPFYNNKRGRVLVYDATTTPPTMKGSPIVGENVNDELGSSIHLVGDGSKIMVYTKKGRVTNYQYVNSEWVVISDQVITSSELDTNFGYSLSSSGDGSRMTITAPLSGSGVGLAQVFSDETSQIMASDFVPPVISLNGPSLFRNEKDAVYTELGVRRDDAETSFITQGSVNSNVAGSYTLTYTAQDNGGNISNSLSRVVDVIDPGDVINRLGGLTAPWNGANNSSMHLSGNGKRVAVCYGVNPEKYPVGTVVGGRSGTVGVYDIDETVYPPILTQYGQEITSTDELFATSINLSQDGNKLSVMTTVDDDTTKISVYGINNTVLTPASTPFMRFEESSLNNNTFSLPITPIRALYDATHYSPDDSTLPTQVHNIHVFGQEYRSNAPDILVGTSTSTTNEYRYSQVNESKYRPRSMATSKDGKIVAFGHSERLSVYRSIDSETIIEVFSVQNTGPTLASSITLGAGDFSEDGYRFITTDSDNTTSIYNVNSGSLQKETDIFNTGGKNALSHNGITAAYTTSSAIDYKIITLVGGDRVTISYGETWTDPGFTYSSDPNDPNDVVTVSGDDFDTTVEGDHVVMYQTPTSQQIRIVKVRPQAENSTGSFSTTNIPYGPSFAGWTGTWRSQDFALFTLPTSFGDFSPENYELTITLNGTIPVAGNWQYMSIQIYTDRGFSSSISFTSNGSGQGESYSYNTGTVYTDKVKTTTTISSGTLNVGDQVRGRLHLYNTFFSTFNVSVEIQNTPSSLRTPIITLTGFSEFSITSTENFTDPGFTSDNSGDALSKTIDPTFPISTSTRKAIVYKAQSSDGINGYAVRYVNVEIRPTLFVKKFQNNTWSTFGNPINLQINEYTIGGLVLSEDGTKLAISQYTSGRGLIYTYEYSQNVYPAGWVQYGSAIDITKSQSSPGFSIAMSGNGLRLVVGIPADSTIVSGDVRVFNYTNTTWQEHTQDTSLYELTGGQVLEVGQLYGYSVDISKDGTHIIVGSPIVNTSYRGHVSVFEISGDAYILKGSPLLRDSSEPEFGRIVSISSDGNYFVTNSGASYTGSQKVVYYKYLNNTWVEHGSGITSVTSPVISTKISGDGTKILTLMDSRNVNIYSPTTTSVSGGWGQLGSDINLNKQSINLPPVETLDPVQPGSRSSPRGMAGYEYIEFDTTGLVVDISHDGTVLAVGLPMIKFRDDLNHTNITGGAAIVFDYDVNTDAWVQSGGMIVPKYVWNPNLQDMYYADGYTGTKTFSNLDLNQRAEANMFSGASISLSGDGQYLCVGSPGYVSNPVDIITTNTYNTTNERMHALPNRAGASSWTLFRRNSAWSPTDDHFSVGWEPLGTKYSGMSKSLSNVYGVSNVDERKREMLGLSVKVASDGSFVAYDTRTDGVKVATLGGSKEVVTAVSLPSTNSFGRYDVNDTAFGTMVPQATQNSATNYEYEINGVVSVPDWDSSVSGQDHTDAVLPLHPETPKTIGEFWRGVPMLHVYSPLLFTVYPNVVYSATSTRNISPNFSLDTSQDPLPAPNGDNRDGRALMHAFIRTNGVHTTELKNASINNRSETNFGFGEILSTSKDCKFMVTRRHLWGEFASGGLTNWEGGTGTDGLKAQSHIHKWLNTQNMSTYYPPNRKNFLTDYHSFSEVHVYYRNSPSDDWVQRGSTSDLRALRYSDVGKKYLIPTNYIYRTLLQEPGHADINNTESTDTTELAKHCGLVLWMENFGTESKISDDGMTLLISNFIGVAADYQINIKGGREFGSQERWETYMPLDEMNDFGNAIYVYKYNTTTGNWDPKSHENLTSDTYVETGFAMGYNSEFGTVEYVSGADYWKYDANIKDDVFNVNNVDHTQAPYPIFPSYFDSRMRSSDILASGSVDPGWSQSRKKRNLDYTSQFARSVSLSGNGNVIAICEPNWNPIYDGNDIGDIRAGSLTGYSPYTFGNPHLHQRIHNDFCRSTVTTGPVSTQRDYNSEDGNFTPIPTISNQYSHMNVGQEVSRGGNTNYWVPLKGMTDGYSTTQDYRHFESSSYVANGFRKAVRPGDCGRVLFMKWNEAQDIYDVDRTLPPFYSIQLLNYVEEDVRQKRYEINSDTTFGPSYGGFQYTVFKCELNSLGDEVTFFASYPSDFMERHGITDVRVGIYTFKLTDAVDISNLTSAEVSALDPLSYYTIGANHVNTNTYPAGWALGYTKYWKLKSKILTSQFTSPINVGVNTQLYFKGDTTLVHSGPNFDWHKQDPGYYTGSYTRDPLYLRDPLSTTEQFSFPTLQYPNWYPSGERREDDKNARILSRRRYVNNWRSGHAANFHGGRSHEEQQNPLDLKVYDGTDTILFRDSQRVYLFKNGVNKTENLCSKTFPTPTGVAGTVMNAAYAPGADTLLVSSSEVDFHPVVSSVETIFGLFEWSSLLEPHTSSRNYTKIRGVKYSNGHVYVIGVYVSDSTYTINNGVTLPATNVEAVFVVKYNSSGVAQWAETIIGSVTVDGGGIAVDSSGNVYVTGDYRSAVSVTLGNNVTLSATSTLSGFVIKYNQYGVVQWAKTIIPPYNQYDPGGVAINDIAVSVNGDVYVTGDYESKNDFGGLVDLGNNVTLPPTHYQYSRANAFVAKYNTDGVAQWGGRLGSFGYESRGRGVVVHSNGIFVTGNYIEGESGGYLSPVIPAPSGRLGYLVDIDHNGIKQWGQYHNRTDVDSLGIVVNDYDIYVLGSHISPNNSSRFLFIEKFSFSGSSYQFIEYMETRETTGSASGYWWSQKLDKVDKGIAVTSTGVVYVCGEYTSTTDLEFTIPLSYDTVTLPVTNGYDGFVLKCLEPTLQVSETKRVYSFGDVFLSAIDADQDDVYIGGHTNGMVYGLNVDDHVTLKRTSTYVASQDDIGVIFKYSSSKTVYTSTRERVVSGGNYGFDLPQNYTITTTPQVFISMYKFNDDAEEISAGYGTYQTIFPARGGSTSYYDIEPISLGYVKSDDVVVDSGLAARFTTPGYTLALNSDATTILFSSGADYTRSTGYDRGSTSSLGMDFRYDALSQYRSMIFWNVGYGAPPPPPHVFMLHEFAQIHTLTKTDTTITQATQFTIQQKLSSDTTKFLQDQNIFTRSAETGESSTYQGWGFMESSLTADTGYGAYPAKFWPTSYLSLSTNDRFLTVSEPVLDPLGLRYSMWNGTDLTPEQNEDLRMGKVTVYDDFIQLGQVITDTPQTTLTPNIDEFAYSESTIYPDGKTIIVPYSIVPNKFGSLTPGNFQKGFSIFTLSDTTTTWSKNTTISVVDTSFTFDGTGGGTGNDFVPEETIFVSLLAGDRVSSFFGGGRLMNTDNTYQVVPPVFRQFQVFNITESSTLWNKIRPDITLTSTDLNRQHWNSNVAGAPSRDERIPDFAMSNDGSVIVIGNENDEIQFTSVNNATRKSGSVSVYKYDTTRLLWSQQKVTVDDDVSSGLATTPYVPARFGRSLALTSDGNSLVVSAPNNRDGSGDIFLFDTSSTTVTKKALTLQNPGGSEFGYSLAVNDDLTRLFIGDPYYSTGSDSQIGRVWVKEYDSTVASGNTLPNGFSGANGVYINPGKDVYNPVYNSVTFGGFSELLRFGEAIDVSSDGNHLIASRFGRFSVGGDILSYMSYFGTIEVAEKWDRNEQTGIWELENIPRINATTEFDLPDASEFQYLSDDQPRQPNVKISDSGETFLAGVESIGNRGTLSVQSNISIFRNSYDFTPVLTLNGPSVVEIGLGDQYIEQGVTSDSSEDTITTTGTVDNTKIGNYILRYSTVRRGLSSFIERTVRVVVQNVQPTVTLIGSESIELEQPATYTEPDPPATFSGGVLETYGVPPDGSTVGVFTIRYQVRNPVGIATATRTVTILPDTTPPVVTKFGGDVIHKVNTIYRDASYIGSDGNEEVIRTTPSYVRTITDVGQYRGTAEITYSAVDSAGNVGTATRNVDVKDVMEATLLGQQLDASYYSTISGDGSRIALIRETTNDVILYDLPASTSTFVGGWNGLGSMEGQMVKLSSDGQIVAFTASDGVRVYAYVSGSWVERTAATSRFAVPGSFMYEIDMSGDGSTISVSYPGGNDQYLEEVVVFSWNGTEYVEEHSIANGTATATGLGSAMSLSSNGSRLALGSPTYSSGSVLSLTYESVILRGVYRYRRYGSARVPTDYYRLTSYGRHGENNTMYWPSTLGSKWSLSWQWYIYGPRWGGADDMRLIYYATNPISAYEASVHNGYNNFYEFWGGDTHQIRDNHDVYRKTQSVYYGTSRWLNVNVSYDNGIMTSTIMDRGRLVSTLTHDFGTEHQHLYGTPTYIGFSGRTGGVTSSQTITHINFSGGVVNGGEIEVYERSGNLWTQLGESIEGGSNQEGLGSSVKLSGDGSTLVNVSVATDGNKQKVNVFSLTNGIWTKKPTLIDNLLKRTGFNGNTNDLVDVSDDGSLLIYAKGVGSERYASHPDGLSTKYIDGFKLENGQYTPVLLIPESSTTSSLPTKHVEVSGDGSKVLIHADDQVDVYTVTETVFNPVITLSYGDYLYLDTLITTSYTEQGATSNVTDGSLVIVGGDVVTTTPGTYRVTYSVTDTNTGKSGHRTRTVIIT